jgi:hypothetical protein
MRKFLSASPIWADSCPLGLNKARLMPIRNEKNGEITANMTQVEKNPAKQD